VGTRFYDLAGWSEDGTPRDEVRIFGFDVSEVNAKRL